MKLLRHHICLLGQSAVVCVHKSESKIQMVVSSLPVRPPSIDLDILIDLLFDVREVRTGCSHDHPSLALPCWSLANRTPHLGGITHLYLHCAIR